MLSLQDICRQALGELVKPMVQFAVRRSLRIQDFNAAIKAAFLEVAQEELSKTGQPISASKLSALTGLQRHEVRKIERSDNKPKQGGDLITRIIGLWQGSNKFKDKGGRPRVLSFKGRSGEFESLVSSVSTDLNPYTVLFELERANLAKQTKKGIQLLRSGYEPRGNISEGLRLLAEDSRDLHRSVEYNLFLDPAEPHLHVKTEYDNIPRSKLPAVKKWFLEKGSAFHEEARKYLAKLDRDTNPKKGQDIQSEPAIRAVLGTFGFVEERR